MLESTHLAMDLCKVYEDHMIEAQRTSRRDVTAGGPALRRARRWNQELVQQLDEAERVNESLRATNTRLRDFVLGNEAEQGEMYAD